MKERQNEASRLIETFKAQGLSLSLAESCTGGMIAAAVTEIAGASDIFWGSAVTYINSAKENILGVSKETLERHGAVSAQCASEMARGSRKIFGAKVALSVTGIAGPGGGSAQKPVGTVWFGISTEEGERAFLKTFDGARDEVRSQTVDAALASLLEYAKERASRDGRLNP